MATTNPSPTSVDLPRIEAAGAEILAAIGEDPVRDGLLNTPSRVARMCAEVMQGLHEDPARSRSEAMGFITGEQAR